MTMLDRYIHYLHSHKVCYSHSIHAPAASALEVADRDRVLANEIAKSVAYIGDNGYGLAVVPADCEVDLRKLRILLGLIKIRVASEAELESILPGAGKGPLPPFGSLFGVPVLLDSELAIQDFIAFSAGSSRDVIRISVVDFLKLVNPSVGSIGLKMGRDLAERAAWSAPGVVEVIDHITIES